MISLWPRLPGRGSQALTAALEQHLGVKSRIDARRDFDEVDFVAFDTELTGLDARRDSIISVGAVRLRGGRILAGRTFYRLLKPATELKPEGVLVHELTNADLEHAADAAEVIEGFVDFLGDAVLIGHFVFIDSSFLGRAMKRCFGVRLQTPTVDTRSLHEWLSENVPAFARHHGGLSLRNDLTSMATRYGVPVQGVHNSFQDAFVTAQLFQRFVPFLRTNGVVTLKELLAVGRS